MSQQLRRTFFVMRTDNEDARFRHQLRHPCLGLVLKGSVADTDKLIRQDDHGIVGGRGREGEAQHHARRIGALGRVQIGTDLGEIGNLGEARAPRRRTARERRLLG